MQYGKQIMPINPEKHEQIRTECKDSLSYLYPLGSNSLPFNQLRDLVSAWVMGFCSCALRSSSIATNQLAVGLSAELGDQITNEQYIRDNWGWSPVDEDHPSYIGRMAAEGTPNNEPTTTDQPAETGDGMAGPGHSPV
jgi:hypothetical protein